jgi:hypothetical protein
VKRAAALALTVALHLILLAMALVRCAPEASAKPPPATSEQPENERVLDVRLLPSGESTAEEAPACESTFRGVGLMHNGIRVQSLAPGGPADRAGLKVGDVILNAEVLGQDRYMVGHRLTLKVSRDGRHFAVDVVVGRICFE